MTTTNQKEFILNYNIGKVKYAVSYHDGVQTHKDGSKFFGINTFSNKKKRDLYIKELLADGYIQK